jgi:hypothetical protein
MVVGPLIAATTVVTETVAEAEAEQLLASVAVMV